MNKNYINKHMDKIKTLIKQKINKITFYLILDK